jgi:hypothetical protein
MLLCVCCAQDVDIYTVKKEELDFSSKFALKVTRDDYCHAVVAYFTVDFSKSHTKLGFSTSQLLACCPPHLLLMVNRPAQPVHALEANCVLFGGAHPLQAERDHLRLNRCEGAWLMTLLQSDGSVQRNAKNPRDIDITIETSSDGAHGKQQSKKYRLR